MIVVRVLWGDSRAEGWTRVWYSDVIKWRSREPHPDHQWVYVYGRENADLLTKIKVPNVVLVDPLPWPNGQIDTNRAGKRPWRNKFELLAKALKDHGEVIYCDWDVGYRRQDLGYVESKLAGRKTTLAAFRYSRPRHPERKRGSHFGVTGAWIHMRGLRFVRTVLDSMVTDDEEWAWHDELAMGHVLDRQNDGWVGEERWLREYESPLFVVPECWSPWKRLTDDGFTVTRKTPVPFVWERVFA